MSDDLLDYIRNVQAKYKKSDKIMKPQVGDTRLRVLPPLSGEHFAYRFAQHWIKPRPNDKPVAVVACRDIVYDEPCPICAAIQKAKLESVDDATLTLLASWEARPDWIFNASVVRDNKAAPTADDYQDAVIFSLKPKAFMNDLCANIKSLKDDDIDMLDPKTGRDIVVTRTGQSMMDTVYTITVRGKSTAVPDRVLNSRKSLVAFISDQFRDQQKALNAIANITGTGSTTAFTSAHALLPIEDMSGGVSKATELSLEDLESLLQDSAA